MKIRKDLVTRILLFGLTAVLVMTFQVGCGKPAEQKAEDRSNRGDVAMAQNNPIGAMDEYVRALEYAQKGLTDAQKEKDPAVREQRLAQAQRQLDEAKANIEKARQKANEMANARLQAAENQVRTDPFAADRELEKAKELANARYGNDPNVIARVQALQQSPDMMAVRVSRKMDQATYRINDWLFARSYYSNSDWGTYWRLDSYMQMVRGWDELDQMLVEWQGHGSPVASQARAELASMKTTFNAWRLVAMLSSDVSEAQGILLISFLETHMKLRATLRGTVDVNYWNLRSVWGISYYGDNDPYYRSNGRRFSYTGTGDGNSGGYNSGTGTGSGNTGTGTGTGSGYGSGNTGTGTGTGRTGTGTGSGYGSGSTGTGTGSTYGSGSTGTGTGSGRTGTGTGSGSGTTGSRDDFDDIHVSTPRSTGTGTGTGSSRTGTGTGTGTGTTRSTGTGTGTGR